MDKLKTVSVHDPAIDTVAMSPRDMREFGETRDLAHLKFHAGIKPCVYTLGDISHQLMTSFVMDTGSEAVRNMHAFMCAVDLVENLVQEDGTTIAQWSPTRNAAGVMNGESLQRFTPQEIQEIGGVAFARSFFGHKRRPRYALPPLSVALLVEQTYRPADASPSSAAPSSSEASPEQEVSAS